MWIEIIDPFSNLTGLAAQLSEVMDKLFHPTYQWTSD